MNESERAAKALLEDFERNELRPSRVITAAGAALLVAGVVMVVLYLNRVEPYREPDKPTVQMSDDEYATYVARRIEGISRTGKRAKERLQGLRGAVEVQMIVGNNGMAETRMTRSSGDSVVDTLTMSEIQLAQPFGRPPPSVAGKLEIRARLTGKQVDGRPVLVVERLP